MAALIFAWVHSIVNRHDVVYWYDTWEGETRARCTGCHARWASWGQVVDILWVTWAALCLVLVVLWIW